MTSRYKVASLIRVSFQIAIIIFFTAVCSEFSIRMFYSSENLWVKTSSGFIAILMITFLFIIILALMPDVRKALLRMFGMEEKW